jgi:hypothetical protein
MIAWRSVVAVMPVRPSPHRSPASAPARRPAGQSVLTALRGFILSRGPFAANMPAERREMRDLILRTPALREYQRKLWISAEGALAEAIAAATDGETIDPALHALAHFVLEVPGLAGLDPRPRPALHAIFDLLENGWSDQVATRPHSDVNNDEPRTGS